MECRTDVIGTLKDIMKRDTFIKMFHQATCPNPSCNEKKQIELVSKDIPAQWKCRICHTKFEHEPVSLC